jgi:hypothetical protein
MLDLALSPHVQWRGASTRLWNETIPLKEVAPVRPGGSPQTGQPLAWPAPPLRSARDQMRFQEQAGIYSGAVALNSGDRALSLPEVSYAVMTKK